MAHELPTAEAFLQGTDGMHPLHHGADALGAFAVGFDDVPLAEHAAERLVALGRHAQNDAWLDAHDAAHGALAKARSMAEGTADAETIATLFRSQAPSAKSLDAIKEPALIEVLAPLKAYLTEFSEPLRDWAMLRPKGMRVAEGEGITPAQHRAANPLDVAEAVAEPIAPLRVFSSERTSSIHQHDANCNHGPGWLFGRKEEGGSGLLSGFKSEDGKKVKWGAVSAWAVAAVGAVGAIRWFNLRNREQKSEPETPAR